MSSIKFSNGTTLETKLINKTNIFSKGENREALEIHFGGTTNTFDDLYSIASNKSNLVDLIVIDNDNEYVYPKYEIFHSLNFENGEFILTIAQLTEHEIRYNELLKRIEALEA